MNNPEPTFIDVPGAVIASAQFSADASENGNIALVIYFPNDGAATAPTYSVMRIYA